MDSTATTVDINALKDRLKAVWTAGDFAEIARSFEKGAADFVYRLKLQPGTRVLDVACGNGNSAIPAAHAGAEVTGLDLAPYLVEQARERAKAEGVDATFDVGDVEAMPYGDAKFDAVVTMYGAMFAPRPELAASEMLRVTRTGGMVAMANWTVEGFIGQMFKIISKYVQPPAGMPSPLLWGNEETVSERLGNRVTDLRMIRRCLAFDYEFGPDEVVDCWFQYYGPTKKAFDAVDPDKKSDFRNELIQLWSDNNSTEDGTTHVLSEYLEVHATRA